MAVRSLRINFLAHVKLLARTSSSVTFHWANQVAAELLASM